MRQFYILIAVVFFLSFSAAFGATVSGEIGTNSSPTIKSPKTVIVNSNSKKPIVKAVIKSKSATVSYTSPAGRETIVFTVRTRDGVITSATARPKAKNKISQSLQKAFTKDLSKKVVGKKTKDFHVDAIGGASLTTAAFEEFVKKMP